MSVVDKRITPRWMNYERLDTGVGVLIEVMGAVVLVAACAFGLAHTSAFGNSSDISSTAAELQRHVGMAPATCWRSPPSTAPDWAGS